MPFFSRRGSGLVPLQPKAASHEPITNRSYTSDRWYMSGSSLSFRIKEKLKSLNRVATGFTLIELLVVIAIIGILASIVLAALNSARQRSRDVRRLADINQLQKAIELYYDDAGSYPSALADIVPTYIAIEPHDPLDPTKSYNYCQLSSSSYHIAASLETSNDALNNDSDMITTCASGGQDIAGNDAAQCNSANDPAAISYCYDVVH